MCFGLVAKKRKIKLETLKFQIPSSVISTCLALGWIAPWNPDVTPGCFLKRIGLLYTLLGSAGTPQAKPLPSRHLNGRAFLQLITHCKMFITQISHFLQVLKSTCAFLSEHDKENRKQPPGFSQEEGSREGQVSLLQTVSLNNHLTSAKTLLLLNYLPAFFFLFSTSF